MAYPDVIPSDFAGDGTDFLKVKKDPSGAVRNQYRSVSVADSASAGTVYGLVPFQKGFRFSYASTIHVTDLDTATNVTLNVGYLYDTSTASDADAFASAVTTAQTGGFITFDEATGLGWVAIDDGWLTTSIAAGTVTTAGTIKAEVLGCYDGDTAAN